MLAVAEGSVRKFLSVPSGADKARPALKRHKHRQSAETTTMDDAD
jgi:hypothetical protein